MNFLWWFQYISYVILRLLLWYVSAPSRLSVVPRTKSIYKLFTHIALCKGGIICSFSTYTITTVIFFIIALLFGMQWCLKLCSGLIRLSYLCDKNNYWAFWIIKQEISQYSCPCPIVLLRANKLCWYHYIDSIKGDRCLYVDVSTHINIVYWSVRGVA